jgi:hypothetical protein
MRTVSRNENPILYVEELQRFPLRRRHRPVAGAVLVYRARNGRLTMPKGGYTAAELLWHAPELSYEIDVSRHAANLLSDIGGESFDVSISWVVTDPIAVVNSRLTHPYELALEVLPARLQQANDLLGDLPIEITLPEGISITVHYVFWLPGETP